jgi:hypothetical protein
MGDCPPSPADGGRGGDTLTSVIMTGGGGDSVTKAVTAISHGGSTAGAAVTTVRKETVPVTAEERAAAVQAVKEMLGPGQEIVSVEKNVCVREEEVLLVNGTPITLEGEEGRAIKDCLLKGSIPNQDLINHLLLKAGLLRQPVKVQTSLNVKSSNTQAENIFLHKNGTILDENCSQRTEVKEYTSKADETWVPAPASNLSSSEDEGDEGGEELSGQQLQHSSGRMGRDTVDRTRSRGSEPGKLLKDRLMSTDSDSGFEKYENLCAKNANSQESLDVSFDSVFNKTTDTPSVCSMNR